MAGIGFELRRLLHEDSDLLSRIRGFASAGLVAAGPWLMTIVTLSIVAAVAPFFADRADYEAFRAFITYGFAFSLITVGLVQMSFTRKLADHLYGERFDRLLPAFASACTWVTIIETVIAVIFCIIAGFDLGVAVCGVILFVILSLNWLALIWLSATKDHDAILGAYAKGCALSIAVMVFVGFDVFGLKLPGFGTTTGLIAGYAAGQGLTLAKLVAGIARQMEAGGKPSNEILKSLHSYPRLALVGFLYNAAIWIDQLVLWFSEGTGVYWAMPYHPVYDTCRFFAYLTVLPTLIVNLVIFETSFFECYRRFYGSILHDWPLEDVARNKQKMLETLREGTVRILRVQGAISVLVLCLADPMAEFLALPPYGASVLRACCVGAFFHALLLVNILVLLYFDLRGAALRTTAVFFVTNFGMAFWAVDVGPQAYGVGYAMAAFLALMVGHAQLGKKVDQLELLAFVNREE